MTGGVQVFTAECEKLPDGRVRHYFRKRDDGRWICENCGEEGHGFAQQRRAV